MAAWKWIAIACGALLVGAVAVAINLPNTDPRTHIAGARNGVVPGLAVTDGDYDRWFVPAVTDFHEMGTDGRFSFIYYTSICDKQGFVGYASQRSAEQVRLTMVAGESGANCDDVAVEHHGEIRLDEPIAGRQVVVVRPVHTVRG